MNSSTSSDNLCRLCPETKGDFIWVYDTRVHHDIKNIIRITTGVEILETDEKSQKICKSCCQAAIQAYKFKKRAYSYDRTQQEKKNKIKQEKAKIKILENLCISKPGTKASKFKMSDTTAVHPSIKSILDKYPHINLPENINLGNHYGPYVTLMTNEVDNWFQNYSLNKKDEVKENDPKDCALKSNRRKRSIYKGVSYEEIESFSSSDEDIRNVNKKKKKLASKFDPPIDDTPASKKIKVLGSSGKVDPATKVNQKQVLSVNHKTNSTQKPISTTVNKINKDVNSESSSSLNEGVNNTFFAEQISRQNDKVLNQSTTFSESNGCEKSGLELIEKNGHISQQHESLEKAPENVLSSDNLISKKTELEEDITQTEKVSSIRSHEVSQTLPESVLVSDVTKSVRLYTCKICDSFYYNVKSLQNHERRTHTKCQFCQTKFKSLDDKNDHLNICKTKATEPGALNEVQVVLPKIEKIPEIRKKYQRAFNEQLYTGTSEVSDDESDLVSLNLDADSNEKTSDEEVLFDVHEVINKSECSETVNDEIKPTLYTATSELPSKTTEHLKLTNAPICESDKANIVCISDEEESTSKEISKNLSSIKSDKLVDPSVPISGLFKDSPKVFLVDNNLLKDVDMNDGDVETIKKVLKLCSHHNKFPTVPYTSIAPGNAPRTFVLKHLRKELHLYKIPVQISYDDHVNIKYSMKKPPPPIKKQDFFKDLVPVDLVRKDIQKANCDILKSTATESTNPQVTATNNIPSSLDKVNIDNIKEKIFHQIQNNDSKKFLKTNSKVENRIKTNVQGSKTDNKVIPGSPTKNLSVPNCKIVSNQTHPNSVLKPSGSVVLNRTITNLTPAQTSQTQNVPFVLNPTVSTSTLSPSNTSYLNIIMPNSVGILKWNIPANNLITKPTESKATSSVPSTAVSKVSIIPGDKPNLNTNEGILKWNIPTNNVITQPSESKATSSVPSTAVSKVNIIPGDKPNLNTNEEKSLNTGKPAIRVKSLSELF